MKFIVTVQHPASSTLHIEADNLKEAIRLFDDQCEGGQVCIECAKHTTVDYGACHTVADENGAIIFDETANTRMKKKIVEGEAQIVELRRRLLARDDDALAALVRRATQSIARQAADLVILHDDPEESDLGLVDLERVTAILDRCADVLNKCGPPPAHEPPPVDKVTAARNRAYDRLVAQCQRLGVSARAMGWFIQLAYSVKRETGDHDNNIIERIKSWQVAGIHDLASKTAAAFKPGGVSYSDVGGAVDAIAKRLAILNNSASARERIEAAGAKVEARFGAPSNPEQAADHDCVVLMLLARDLRHEEKASHDDE